MDNDAIAFGLIVLFIASIWAILLLWTIYKVLVAILEELRSISKTDRMDQ
ncbi:MAG: hypothetical protein ABSA42_00320 [Terracidiphilus sp.]